MQSGLHFVSEELNNNTDFKSTLEDDLNSFFGTTNSFPQSIPGPYDVKERPYQHWRITAALEDNNQSLGEELKNAKNYSSTNTFLQFLSTIPQPNGPQLFKIPPDPESTGADLDQILKIKNETLRDKERDSFVQELSSQKARQKSLFNEYQQRRSADSAAISMAYILTHINPDQRESSDNSQVEKLTRNVLIDDSDSHSTSSSSPSRHHPKRKHNHRPPSSTESSSSDSSSS